MSGIVARTRNQVRPLGQVQRAVVGNRANQQARKRHAGLQRDDAVQHPAVNRFSQRLSARMERKRIRKVSHRRMLHVEIRQAPVLARLKGFMMSCGDRTLSEALTPELSSSALA